MKSHQVRQATANLIEMQEQINIGCWGDNLSYFIQDYLSMAVFLLFFFQSDNEQKCEVDGLSCIYQLAMLHLRVSALYMIW